MLLALLAQAADPANCAAALGRADLSAFAKSRICHALGAERIFDGVWFDDFEGQVFVEGAHTVAEARGRSGAWLDNELSHTERQRWHMAGSACGHAYHIRFTGAAAPPTAKEHPFPAGYGQMGFFRNLVAIDRLIANTDLGEQHGNAPYCRRTDQAGSVPTTPAKRSR